GSQAAGSDADGAGSWTTLRRGLPPGPQPQGVGRGADKGETVAVGKAVLAAVPVGNAVVLPEQHAIECTRSSDLLLAAARGEEFFQQRIDDWVVNAGVVLAAFDGDLA